MTNPETEDRTIKLREAITQAMAKLGGLSEERETAWQRQRQADDAFEQATKRAAALGDVRSQLPPPVLDALVHDRAEQTEAMRAVTRWLVGTSPVLVISGDKGCGKTVAMAAALAKAGGSWVTCTQLTRRSQANFGAEAEEYERLLRARRLYIDDVGTERLPAEAVTSMLVEVIEKRGGVRTILTTNLSLADFTRRYSDPRLTSRMARVTWVGCTGSDLRRRAP
jgi:DNA replication protein DnaC